MYNFDGAVNFLKEKFTEQSDSLRENHSHNVFQTKNHWAGSFSKGENHGAITF